MTKGNIVETREPSLNRTIPRAFFPMSPAATASEAILSDLIRGVSGTKAHIVGWSGLQSVLESELGSKYGEDVATEFVRGVEAAYTRVNTTDSRKKRNKNRYLIPFHPEIGRCVRPQESRRWQDWYAMLMCNVDGDFNEELHDQLLTRLDALEPSNVVEQVIIEHLERDEGERKAPAGVLPYNVDLAKRFQEDLAAWLTLTDAASYEWLQGFGFILTTYIMLDFIQLALNLDEEFAVLGDSDHDTQVLPVSFGMDEDIARGHRSFSSAWGGIETSLYRSWGHLAALRICIEAEDKVQRPHEFAKDNAAVVLEALNDEIAAFGGGSEENVAKAMQAVAKCVHEHYQLKPRANQTPISLGINVVKQLGSGHIQLIYSHRGIGTTLRLSREAIVLLTRICTLGSADSIHLPAFFKWLEKRSIKLDKESQKICLEALEQMGFVERHSDAGDAVYVRAI